MSPKQDQGNRHTILTILYTPELWRNATLVVTFRHLPDPEDAGNIRIIQTVSAGLDHLLSHPILQKTNIPITTSTGIHGPPVAEWTVVNWLTSARKYIYTHEAQKQHRWADTNEYMSVVSDQVSKKVGILGYGSIGRQIARVAAALGMTVHAYTASERPTPASRRDTHYVVPGTGDTDGSIPVSWHHGVDKESVHAFLSLGLDHLVICVPLTPQTTHLIGKDEFALLASNSRHPFSKPYVTNIARGKVLDQEALIAALEDGSLSGAAVDVTDPEPLPADHPLWDAPNLQISPHISGIGREYLPRVFDIVRLNLDRERRGERLVNEYNRNRGY